MALCGMKGPFESVGEIIIRHGLNRRKGTRVECVRQSPRVCFYSYSTQHHSLYTNPYLIRLSLIAPSLLVYPCYVVLWDAKGGKGTGKKVARLTWDYY